MVEMGEPYPTCGAHSGHVMKCPDADERGDNGHYFHAHDNTCGRVLCPICGHKAVWAQSITTAGRYKAIRAEWRKKGLQSITAELIAYPPKTLTDATFYTRQGWDYATSKLNVILPDFGVLGGFRLYHQTAVNRHEGANYHEYEKYKKGEPCRVRINPHFQGIVELREDWDSQEFREKRQKWIDAGWFIRLQPSDGSQGSRPWSIRGRRLAKKISYELGHAEIQLDDDGSKTQILAWFGLMSYNNGHGIDRIHEEKIKCKCGKLVYHYYEGVCQELAIKKVHEYVYTLNEILFARAIKRLSLTVSARYTTFEGVTALKSTIP